MTAFAASGIYDFTLNSIDGAPAPLSASLPIKRIGRGPAAVRSREQNPRSAPPAGPADLLP